MAFFVAFFYCPPPQNTIMNKLLFVIILLAFQLCNKPTRMQENPILKITIDSPDTTTQLTTQSIIEYYKKEDHYLQKNIFFEYYSPLSENDTSQLKKWEMFPTQTVYFFFDDLNRITKFSMLDKKNETVSDSTQQHYHTLFNYQYLGDTVTVTPVYPEPSTHIPHFSGEQILITNQQNLITNITTKEVNGEKITKEERLIYHLDSLKADHYAYLKAQNTNENEEIIERKITFYNIKHLEYSIHPFKIRYPYYPKRIEERRYSISENKKELVKETIRSYTIEENKALKQLKISLFIDENLVQKRTYEY